jgi:hypothetical protein
VPRGSRSIVISESKTIRAHARALASALGARSGRAVVGVLPSASRPPP